MKFNERLVLIGRDLSCGINKMVNLLPSHLRILFLITCPPPFVYIYIKIQEY